VRGSTLLRPLALGDAVALLEIELEPQVAWCRVHAEPRVVVREIAAVHTAALRLLGLTLDVPAFEARAAREPKLAALLARRPGLRLPLTANGFEALCWAIIGQQINLTFASGLRRDLLELAGTEIEGMRVHPTAARVAEMHVGDLTRRRFSRTKAEYVIGAAQAVASGRLDAESLGNGSAVAAERDLTRLHGVGTWTARYTLMRGAGFADCAPVGDVALAAALQRLTAAGDRPGPDQVEELMRPYAPHRSLATFHLWASLRDTA
jgi:3-methyladenine DNA glycosylase/8-oxoguanine DNA glycosylase